MKSKKLIALALAVVMTLTLFAGCGNNAASNPTTQNPTGTNGSDDAQSTEQKTEKVELTAGVQIYDAAKRLPAGDTLEDNAYTRYFEEVTNIHVTNVFEAQYGEAYRQKVKLAAASNDLPDIMFINKDDYSLLTQLVEFDQIADLTDYFNNSLNPDIREKLTSGDGSAMASATFDGRIMAIPEPTLQYDMVRLLWVRQDWLDKLNLEAPKTVEDLMTVAKAFMEQDPDGNGKDDTYGLVATKDYSTIFEPIFNAYKAYPTMWYENADGEVVYGGVEPEAKEALAVLHQMYEEGIIDTEFAAREIDNEMVASNRAGLFFSPWWAPWGSLPDSVSNDPNAEWKAYALPLNADGEFLAPNAAPVNSYMVVSSECKDIEAVFRYFNACTDLNAITQQGIYSGMEGLNESYRLSAVSFVTDYVDCIPRKHLLYKAILAGEETVGGPTDFNPVETQMNIDFININTENPKQNMEAWMTAAAYMDGVAPIVDNPTFGVKTGSFYGVTETMETKWANLKQLQDQTFLGIIAGTLSLDSFDSFVEQWYAQGGNEITAEVRASAG